MAHKNWVKIERFNWCKIVGEIKRRIFCQTLCPVELSLGKQILMKSTPEDKNGRETNNRIKEFERCGIPKQYNVSFFCNIFLDDKKNLILLRIKAFDHTKITKAVGLRFCF